MIKNKSGLSIIISTVLLILLGVIISGIIWGVTTNLINNKIDNSKSCFNIYNQISINKEYTCYNNTNGVTQFSINMGDIDVESILFSIAKDDISESFEINYTPTMIDFLTIYGSDMFGSTLLVLPQKEEGKTYKYYQDGLFASAPDSIKIAPIINGNHCGVIDSLENIQFC